MKTRFINKFKKMPLRELFSVNISEHANTLDNWYDFVVTRCQKELGIEEKNYFKCKRIVLAMISDETNETQHEGTWMKSKERAYYQLNKIHLN